MNIRDTMREMMQSEINRLNTDMLSGNLNPRQYSKANRRRSEIIARARALKIKLRIV